MGFFDTISELFEAATPWSTVEAEAPTDGGSSTVKTPANSGDKGEGEVEDESAPTPDKRSPGDDNQVGGKAASGNVSNNKDDSEDEDEPEEEEDDEPVDPKDKLVEECEESKSCAPFKHHFDECVERVTGADDSESDKKHPKEDCVEEFFHLAHCATQCAAPKLWAQLK